MHNHSFHPWQHDHIFGQDEIKSGERRTILVIAITATMMIIEIGAGIAFGSMALLADGLHMASHTVALGVTAFAYLYARMHARNRSFSYGTGKVNALAGFTSAIILAVFALVMAWESVNRFFNPVDIIFNQAITVAVIGFIVNALSLLILGHDEHKKEHRHSQQSSNHSDHNIRAAYLHVLADALTSLLAILALSAGKFFALEWMDPLMGIIGALLVSKWSWGLLRDSSNILLDKQASPEKLKAVKKAIEQDDNRITDLHLWSIGPDIYTAAIAIVTDKPKPPEHYKNLLPKDIGLVHSTIEVHQFNHKET